jgi:ribosomal protein S21
MPKTVHLEVVARKDEPTERLIKRFLKKMKKEKLLEEFQKHLYYEKPSDAKQRMKKERKEVLRKLSEKNQEGQKKRKK